MPNRRETPRTPNRPGQSQLDFSPIHIRTFLQCHERYYWRYIHPTKTPRIFSRNLEIGRACHNVLAFIWNQRRAGFEDPDDLPGLVGRYLKQRAYPPDDAIYFQDDLMTIATHVQRALDSLDAEATVFGVEQEFAYALTGDVPEGVEIRSKIDLVLEHAGGEIEHIDYKTGKPDRDLVQEAMSRVVLKSTLKEAGLGDRPIVTTTLFTTDGSAIREELDRDQFRNLWAEIVGSIELIRTGEIWRPNPGPYCRWCDFADYTCSVRGDPNQT